MKPYYEANRTKRIEYQRSYNLACKKTIRLKQRAYYQANKFLISDKTFNASKEVKAKRAKYLHDYYLANRTRLLEYKRLWRARNKENKP